MSKGPWRWSFYGREMSFGNMVLSSVVSALLSSALMLALFSVIVPSWSLAQGLAATLLFLIAFEMPIQLTLGANE